MIGIFLDTETNGLDFVQNKTLEIAICLMNLENFEVLHRYDTCIYYDKEIFLKSDPQSLYINGFTYDMIETGKTIDKVAFEIKEIFNRFNIKRDNAIFVCQNPSFDRAFFSQILTVKEQEKMRLPYHWLDLASMFFALQFHAEVKPWKIGFSKDKIAKHLFLDEEKRPHRAMNGVDHLICCYKALFSR